MDSKMCKYNNNNEEQTTNATITWGPCPPGKDSSSLASGLGP